MYAISTSEVRQLTGIMYERERRGVELDADQVAKNQQFLEAMHNNTRFKLSECLKDKPFVSLNPSAKAQILATLCNDLLLNKAVCKQIEASLEAQAHLKREKIFLDAKIRKCKLTLTRKSRLENYERSIAQVTLTTVPEPVTPVVGNADKKVDEAPANMSGPTDPNGPTDTSTPIKSGDRDENDETEKKETEEENKEPQDKEIKDETAATESKEAVKPVELTTTTDVEMKELAPPETPEKSAVSDRDAPTPASVASDRRKPSESINEKMEDENSDIESDDGTQMEEDEDGQMMFDELQKKLEDMLEESSRSKELLIKACNQVRAKCYGQDRYWRRYWHLPKSGGIFVEGLESAQPEITKYHELLEAAKIRSDELNQQQLEHEKRNKRAKRSKAKSECNDSEASMTDGNLSDGVIQHTNKDNYSLVEEKFVQPTPNVSSNDEEMDIEESLPTAILVQKNNNAGEAIEPPTSFNVPKAIEVALTPAAVQPPSESVKTDPTTQEGCDKAEIKTEIKDIKSDADEIKTEKTEDEDDSKDKPLMDKWFSLIRREVPLMSAEAAVNLDSKKLYCSITCRDSVIGQGHRWDVGNNLYFYTHPDEVKHEPGFSLSHSIMSLSGLPEKDLEDVVANNGIPTVKKEPEEPEKKVDPKEETIPGFSLPPYMALSLNNLTNYLQCDSPGPVPTTPEEQRQLEDIKTSGAPTRLENNFVPNDSRRGWWKINEIEHLNEVIQCLNPRGIRERNLRQNILATLTESIDLTTPCPVANPRAPPPIKGYIDAEPMNAWNPQIARRVELALLDQVESMEDKIASASMQIKGWNVPQRDNDSEENSGDFINLQSIGERILSLEAAIERRYLKPPLGTNTTDAQIAALAQKKEEKEKEKEKDKDDPNVSSGSDTDEAIPRGKTMLNFNLPQTKVRISSIYILSGLLHWRDAVEKSWTCAQLAMALYVLESCVAWDKSIMKAVSVFI